MNGKNAPSASFLIRSESLLPNPNSGFGFKRLKCREQKMQTRALVLPIRNPPDVSLFTDTRRRVEGAARARRSEPGSGRLPVAVSQLRRIRVQPEYVREAWEFSAAVYD